MNERAKKLAEELDKRINEDGIQFVEDEFVTNDQYLRTYEGKDGTMYFETYKRTNVERVVEK